MDKPSIPSPKEATRKKIMVLLFFMRETGRYNMFTEFSKALIGGLLVGKFLGTIDDRDLDLIREDDKDGILSTVKLANYYYNYPPIPKEGTPEYADHPDVQAGFMPYSDAFEMGLKRVSKGGEKVHRNKASITLLDRLLVFASMKFDSAVRNEIKAALAASTEVQKLWVAVHLLGPNDYETYSNFLNSH